jgi:hypothetical protein
MQGRANVFDERPKVVSNRGAYLGREFGLKNGVRTGDMKGVSTARLPVIAGGRFKHGRGVQPRPIDTRTFEGNSPFVHNMISKEAALL